MNRRETCLLLAAILCLGASPTRAADDDVHEGKVSSISDGKLAIIEKKSGDGETFDVAAGAKITLNGKPSSLEKLSEGDIVRVTFQTKDGKATATAIAAKSPE